MKQTEIMIKCKKRIVLVFNFFFLKFKIVIMLFNVIRKYFSRIMIGKLNPTFMVL